MTSIKKILIDLWMHSPLPSKDKVRRYREKQWNDKHLNRHAEYIRDIFHGFDYIIEADYNKIFVNIGTGDVRMYDDFRREYCYPSRELGDHTQIILLRGMHTNDERIFARTEFGSDHLFLGTNNELDAIILKLKYSI